MAVNGVYKLTYIFVIITTIKYLGCNGEKLEMTHKYTSDAIYWPNGQASFTLDVWANNWTSKGYWYKGDDIETGNHVGTHMDAPCHFYKDTWCIGDIPLDNLVGPGVFIDIRSKVNHSADTNLTLEDVQAWETQYGRIPEKSVIFMCSGWSDYYPNKTKVFGSDTDDTSTFHFPGFEVEAVRWLVEERGIIGVGSDTPSTDWAQTTYVPVHVYIGSVNVYGLENVKGTCDVPPSGSTVYVYPMYISEASGAPTRIVAYWNTDPAVSGCSKLISSGILLLLTSMLKLW